MMIIILISSSIFATKREIWRIPGGCLRHSTLDRFYAHLQWISEILSKRFRTSQSDIYRPWVPRRFGDTLQVILFQTKFRVFEFIPHEALIIKTRDCIISTEVNSLTIESMGALRWFHWDPTCAIVIWNGVDWWESLVAHSAALAGSMPFNNALTRCCDTVKVTKKSL